MADADYIEIGEAELQELSEDEFEILMARLAGASRENAHSFLGWRRRRALRAWRGLTEKGPSIASRARRRRGSSLRTVVFDRVRGVPVPEFASILTSPEFREIMSMEVPQVKPYSVPNQRLPKHLEEEMFRNQKQPENGRWALPARESTTTEKEMATKQQAPETVPTAPGGVLPTGWDAEIQQVSAKLEKLHRQRSGIEEQRRQQAARVVELEQQLQSLRLSLDEDAVGDRLAETRKALTIARETLTDLRERGDSFDALRASLLRELNEARERAAAACHPVVLEAYRVRAGRMFEALRPVLALAAELQAIEHAAVEAGVHLGLEKWPMAEGADDPLWALSPDHSRRLRLASELQQLAAIQ